MRRLTFAIALAVAVGSVAVTGAAEPAAAGPQLNGGGSTFAALEIDEWKAQTAREPFNLAINYVAQGSTFGRLQFKDNTLEFGASDIVYEPSERDLLARSNRCSGKNIDNGERFVYVPVSAGGVSFMYNLLDASGVRVNDLRLTRRAVCKIFTGAIARWNDPEILEFNPRLATVDRPIPAWVRADGAGESFVFSEYCLAAAPDVWNAFVSRVMSIDAALYQGTPFANGAPTSSWPKDVAWGLVNSAQGADGVANAVADPTIGTNAIGYVAAGYAKVRNFPVASVQNGAGEFTQPDEENVTVALGYATGRGNGTFDIAYDGPDPWAYFPSTYSYILAQTSGYDPAKGAVLGTFLCYAVTKGQAIAPQLRYARLSDVLVEIAINAIVQIPGAPARENCTVAGAPPPPAAVVPLGAAPQSASGTDSGVNGVDGGAAGTGGTNTGVTTPRRGGTASSAGNVAADGSTTAAAQGADGTGLDDSTGGATDQQLVFPTASTADSDSSSPSVWILVAGAVTAWGLTAPARRRAARR